MESKTVETTEKQSTVPMKKDTYEKCVDFFGQLSADEVACTLDTMLFMLMDCKAVKPEALQDMLHTTNNVKRFIYRMEKAVTEKQRESNQCLHN